MYKDFIHIFVLSCHKATLLIEKSLHTDLSFIERLQLNIHLKLCHFCADYQTDAVATDKALKKLASKRSRTPRSLLTDNEVKEAEERILEKVRSVKK